MSVRTRNEFLEGSDSEDDGVDLGYDSENAEQSKVATAARASKRRKLEGDPDAASLQSGSNHGDNGDSKDDDLPQPSRQSPQDSRFVRLNDEDFDDHDPSTHDAQGDGNDDTERDVNLIQSASHSSRPTIPKSVTKAQKAASKSGVVYISRVPPFMKPPTLRHFLEPHAPHGIGRIFLTPEDRSAHTRRVKNGGNKKKSFVDGWVEFSSKSEAKRVVAALNGNIIGGKKGNFYHDDLWTLKYLTGFKWSHLSEQIANENAEREARMREEIRKTKAENKAFVQDFERGKMMETKQRKGQNKSHSTDVVREKPREFKQKSARHAQAREGTTKQSAELQNVLSKIF